MKDLVLISLYLTYMALCSCIPGLATLPLHHYCGLRTTGSAAWLFTTICLAKLMRNNTLPLLLFPAQCTVGKRE